MPLARLRTPELRNGQDVAPLRHVPEVCRDEAGQSTVLLVGDGRLTYYCSPRERSSDCAVFNCGEESQLRSGCHQAEQAGQRKSCLDSIDRPGLDPELL